MAPLFHHFNRRPWDGLVKPITLAFFAILHQIKWVSQVEKARKLGAKTLIFLISNSISKNASRKRFTGTSPHSQKARIGLIFFPGSGVVTEKPDQDLFVVDTVGDAKSVRKFGEPKLRIDEILVPKSSIGAFTRAKSIKSGEIKKGLSRVELQKVKKVGEKLLNKNKQKTEKKPVDLWGDEEAVPVAPFKAPETLKQLPHVGTAAVDAPHPGISYNPVPEEHENVIKLAYEEEVQKLEHREKLKETVPRPDLILASQRVESVFTMDVDLPSSDDDEEEEAAAADENEVSADEQTKKKEPKRKTKAQRNRERRTKALQQEIERRKKQKQDLAALARLKELEAELEDAKKSKEGAKNDTKSAPKKLSKYEFQALPMTVQLSDELADSLRTLKPEGNLFKERFKTLQKRSMIETRIPVTKRRRYEVKEVEKHSYKKFQ